MSEAEVITALREIKELLRQTLSRFDVQEVRLDAIETRLDAIQGVNGTLAGAQ